MPAAELPSDPVSFLSRHAPFDRLPAALVTVIADSLEIGFAAAGERLLARGGPPSDALWVIRKGSVRLERDGEILEQLGPGECFGYPSLLARRSPLRDAVAAEECLLLRLPAATFERLLGDPTAARFFLDGLTDRLRFAEPATPQPLALTRPLSELVGRPLVTIRPDTTAGEAARRMRERGVGALLVSNETAGEQGLPREALLGLVTDRDLRNRVLAAGRGPETPVSDILTRELVLLPAADTSLDALLTMARLGIRHLPLVAGEQVVGLASASDLLRQQSRDPLALSRRLGRETLPELLKGFSAEVRSTVAGLAAAGVEASRLGPLVASWNDALAGRLLAAAVEALGEPPAELTWMVHGSDGRREQLLPTDQDNALAWMAVPGREAEAASYALAVAERMVDGLATAGFPLCPGGYMATRWSDSEEGWRRRLRGWIEEPRPENTLDLSTLLDLRSAAGKPELPWLDQLRAQAGGERLLLRRLADDCSRWSLPLGLFGGLKEGEGGFDLKRGSLLVVAVARLFALEAGSTAVGTLERLRAAEAVLGEDAKTLAESFRFLARERLRHALSAPPGSGHPLRLEELNPLERRFLKDIFGFLRQLVVSLPQRFALS